MIPINEFFNKCYANMKCNTSYPMYKDDFIKYKVNQDIFLDIDCISCYIHIPFCKSICSFCEYTKFKYNETSADHYLLLLESEIKEFFTSHDIKKIYGFDIGGGTPTVLNNMQLEKLLKLQYDVEKQYSKSCDYEKSIEVTFSTIDCEKIELISKYGFKRVSAGIQSFDNSLISSFNRVNVCCNKINDINLYLKKCGIPKLNIDLMYGLPNQTVKMIEETLANVIDLSPEQVTVYETRYNQNRIKSFATREDVFEQYSYIYNKLVEAGYKAQFGSNAFSKCNDLGVSSYILHRMRDFVSYKGFGISAQSMTLNGLSYNIGKNNSINNYTEYNKISEKDSYLLPREELLAKFFSISMYSGYVKLKDLLMFNNEFFKCYKKELEFLVKKEIISIDDVGIRLTKEGFKYYGAVCALFWSNSQKKIFLEDK